MVRLLVHVEGETEETFVNQILSEHLMGHGYERVSARLLGNARQRIRRGGIRGWGTVKRDIVMHLREDQGCIATTMVDYYGLPLLGEKAWPGRAEAVSEMPVAQKASTVQTALLDDVRAEMGPNFNVRRFVPFVVMHEFEGLLFSDCAAFARGLGRADMEDALQTIRDEFDSPEEINDSPASAPSKRVEALVPEYQKPLFGNMAALEIGLTRIRDACPHFQSWLSELELRAH